MNRLLRAVMPVTVALALAPPASAAQAGRLSLVLQMPLAGQPGSHSGGTLMGTFTGVVDSTLVNGAAVSGSFTYQMPADFCPVQTLAYGSFTIAGVGSVDFTYRRDGTVFTMAMSGGGAVIGAAYPAGGTPCSTTQPAWVEAADGLLRTP